MSSDVGTGGVSGSIPGKEASRWSLEQIFQVVPGRNFVLKAWIHQHTETA